jgi:hypothetical protein
MRNDSTFDILATRTWLFERRLAAGERASARIRRASRAGAPCLACKACIDARLPVSDLLIRAAWIVRIAVSPRAAAKRSFALQFIITERSVWFARVLTTISNITGWRCSLLTQTPNLSKDGSRDAPKSQP